MRKQILFILSTFALLMYPLPLSAQNSTVGDQALTPDLSLPPVCYCWILVMR